VCAHAVRVAIRRMEGVDSVRVSLNEGFARIAFAAGNRVTVEQVREAIRRNGFSPRESRVRVRGRLVRSGDSLALAVPGTAMRFPLVVPAGLRAELASVADDAHLIVDGTVAEGDRRTGNTAPLRMAQFRIEQR